MIWRLADGTEFSAWTSTTNSADRPTYFWVGLDKGEAWYRVREGGQWQRMTLKTVDDEDARRTQFGASQRLPSGRHAIAFRVAAPGHAPVEYCCVSTAVQ
jgi:hypothetical protein